MSQMSDRKFLVMIIVLTWNNFKDTAECLQSLQKIDYPNYRVVLIDNGSEDDSIDKIRLLYPELTIIENKKNLGYAGGNNVGIKYATSERAEYILLLNNDLIVEESLVSEFIRVSEQYRDAGILGGSNYYYDKRNMIQFSDGIIDWKRGNVIDTTRHKIDKGQFERVREVDTVAGSCLFIPTKIIKQIGLLDIRYFLNFEETDWCLRVKKAGYRVYSCLAAKVWHKVSVSGKKRKAGINILKYYSVRNKFLFLIKNSPTPFLFLSLPYHTVKTIFQILQSLTQGKIYEAKLLISCLRDGILGRYGERFVRE